MCACDCVYASEADTRKGKTDVLSHINMHGRAGPIPTRSIGIINCTLAEWGISSNVERSALVRAKTRITHLRPVEREFADFGPLYVYSPTLPGNDIVYLVPANDNNTPMNRPSVSLKARANSSFHHFHQCVQRDG